MYSGITSGRVLNGELLYTKILEVNLFAFAYRLFRRDFSPLDGTYWTSRIFVYIYIIQFICILESQVISPHSTGHIGPLESLSLSLYIYIEREREREREYDEYPSY